MYMGEIPCKELYYYDIYNKLFNTYIYNTKI